MSMPHHDSHEFRIKHFLGVPILVERYSLPSSIGGPGDWEWSFWWPCRFAHTVYVNNKLMELDKPKRKLEADT